MDFQDKRFRNYHKSGSKSCPDCGSRSINNTFHIRVASSDEAIADRECFTCGFKWRDIYLIVDILPLDNEGGIDGI